VHNAWNSVADCSATLWLYPNKGNLWECCKPAKDASGIRAASDACNYNIWPARRMIFAKRNSTLNSCLCSDHPMKLADHPRVWVRAKDRA
jgi:hypothetical protein